MSNFAYSLFWRLCSRSVTERYSASQALKHPFITRSIHDDIPLTQGEEVRLIETETQFRRAQSAMLFAAITKLSTDDSSSSLISPTYLKKIEMCNNGYYNDNSEFDHLSDNKSMGDLMRESYHYSPENELLIDDHSYCKYSIAE